MAGPSRDERTLAQGRYGTVEYAMRDDGTMEAKEWFEAQDATTQRSFAHLFEQLVNHRTITNEERFRQLDGEVWEFKKRDGKRLLCYRHGNRWLLTHGTKKAGGQRGKCPPSEIAHAKMIAEEQIAREAAEAKASQGGNGRGHWNGNGHKGNR